MALPKAMRYLAAATFLIFLFLFVTLYRSDPAQIKLPPRSAPASLSPRAQRAR